MELRVGSVRIVIDDDADDGDLAQDFIVAGLLLVRAAEELRARTEDDSNGNER